VEYCPLFFKYRRIESITPESVRENIQFRIDDFGMCTPRRKMRMKDFLSFGISEVLAMCVEESILECAVIACDGAGTVVVSDPELIQGIGGRISGLVETSPIAEIIDAIGRDRVLDPERATIDQVRGMELARGLFEGRIGMTVARGEDARSIRDSQGDNVAIFAVHTSGVSPGEAEILFDNCDVITSCASAPLRKLGEKRSLFTAGNKIPIYAATEFGVEIMKKRLEMMKGKKGGKGESDPPRPLI
jgi:putative methanogenesis marker protein 8